MKKIHVFSLFVLTTSAALVPLEKVIRSLIDVPSSALSKNIAFPDNDYDYYDHDGATLPPVSTSTELPTNTTDTPRLSDGAIAGIVIGWVAVLLIIIGSIIICKVKRLLCFD